MATMNAKLTQVQVKPSKYKVDNTLLHEKYANVSLNVIMDTMAQKDAVNELLAALTDQDVYLTVEVVRPALFDAHLDKNKEEETQIEFNNVNAAHTDEDEDETDDHIVEVSDG